MCAERVVPPWPAEDSVCAECGFSYRECSRAEALGIIRQLADALEHAADGVASASLRVRPAAGGWSVTEYLCHVRDVCVVSTLRVHRIRSETRPVLEPMLNDVRATRFRYNEQPLELVLHDLRVVATALQEEILDTRYTDWDRVGVREAAGMREERSLGWVVRNAAHEAVHHLQDVERLVRALGSNP
jgi:hypothetical protein